MVRSIDVERQRVVDITVSLTTPGCPIRGHFQTAVAEAAAASRASSTSNVYFDVLSDDEKPALQQKLGRGSLPAGSLAQVQNVICVGSGKGGVGKSTLTANLAAALAGRGQARRRARRGRVGLLDPAHVRPRRRRARRSRPSARSCRCEAHGVKVMSIGFFVEEDAAVVWRGPMLHKALTQFLQDVEWGALDYLLVDLPPGTGDVSMTLAQLLPQAQVPDRHDAAAGGAEGRAPRGADGREGRARDRRRGREHVRLHDARRRALRDLRRGRRRASSRTSSTCRCSAGCR